MKRISVVIPIFVATSCLVSCYRQPAPDGKHNREQFVNSVRSFPYEASTERQSKLFGDYQKLSVGMSKEQVAAILGDPDYTNITGPKTFFGGIQPHGTEWVYGIHCEDQFCGTAGPDKVVEVFFTLDDRAHWIVPHGIDSLKEIGNCYAVAN